MAGRAHQTLRFELAEQKKIISITDADVTREYFLETGGADSGLVVLDSLRRWRNLGWTVGGTNYKIRAFSELDLANRDLLKQAIVLDIGVGIGLALPLSARTQFQKGERWDIQRGPRGRVDSWGGHYVFVSGYTFGGPVCVTWSRKQQMTWEFFDRYCDEAYAIIDALDAPRAKQVLDREKLGVYLDRLDAESGSDRAAQASAGIKLRISESATCVPPVPSGLTS